MVVHDLSAVHRNFQIPGAGVGDVRLDLNVVVLAGLNRIGISPQRQHLKIAGRIAGISTGRGIASNNLQMVAIKLNREWRRRGRATNFVCIMHFCGDEPIRSIRE